MVRITTRVMAVMVVRVLFISVVAVMVIILRVIVADFVVFVVAADGTSSSLILFTSLVHFIVCHTIPGTSFA